MPRDEHGLIQPQEECRHCDYLKECLQVAIDACGGAKKIKADQGSAFEKPEEPGGIVAAILRWSERKRAAQKGRNS